MQQQASKIELPVIRSMSETPTRNIAFLESFGKCKTSTGLVEITKDLRDEAKAKDIQFDLAFKNCPIPQHDRDAITSLRNQLINKFMVNGNVVRHNTTGDVGIVLSVGYSRNNSKVPSSACEYSCRCDYIDGTEGKFEIATIYFHVKVLLPNGKETTWRVGMVTPLEAEEGFRELIARLPE